MSTRSVVAIPTGAGSWKGRYIHFDGYPDGVGESLRQIVLRDGYNKAVKTLVDDNFSWASIHFDTNELNLFPGRERVPGYGFAENDLGDKWIFSDKDTWGTRYAYVLGESGIEVYETSLTTEMQSTGLLKKGFVRYDDTTGMDKMMPSDEN